MARKEELPSLEISNSKEICGIIMPISDSDNYPTGQWKDVLNILNEVIESSGFQGKIVSDSKVSNIIHEEIMKNLYSNPIVICDVSSKNPNVMFELGLRLAFDKPTIVIKDDATDYNFDTSPIRHLEYPKDLRHSKILHFKDDLKDAITATYSAFRAGEYKTFLQSFTQYKPTIQVEDVDLKDYVIKGFETIKKDIQQLYSTNNNKNTTDNIDSHPVLMIRVKHSIKTGKTLHEFVKKILEKNLSTFDRWFSNMTSTGEMIITIKAPDYALNQLVKALQGDSGLTVTTAYF